MGEISVNDLPVLKNGRPRRHTDEEFLEAIKKHGGIRQALGKEEGFLDISERSARSQWKRIQKEAHAREAEQKAA